MPRGFFITFEGIEGSGKTTQAEILYRTLISRGYPVQFTREPGGTEISEKIRNVLLDRANIGMAPWTELLLYLASRAQLVHEVILPSLQEGKVVLADRFLDSTLAYQGGGRGIDWKSIEKLNRLLLFDCKPDITLLFDLPTQEGKERIFSRRRKDRLEEEGEDFYARVRNAYLRIAHKNPLRVRVINGTQEEGAIGKEVLRIVEERLKKVELSS